jgi:hypothetical protein
VTIRERGDLYVDSDGNRYTTEPFGLDGEPWQGATILSDSVVDRLHSEGRLPLTEVSTS